MQEFFKNIFLGRWSVAKRGVCSQEFLTETVETKDKNRDDYHYMQMNLVISMRFIFGDDRNDACKLNTFSPFGNNVIFPKSRPLIMHVYWKVSIPSRMRNDYCGDIINLRFPGKTNY